MADRGKTEVGRGAKLRKRDREGNSNTGVSTADGAVLVGRQVLRQFDGLYYTGTITSYIPAGHWWHVAYPDGDEEDLGRHQVMKTLISEEGGAISTDPVSFKLLPLPSNTSVLDREGLQLPDITNGLEKRAIPVVRSYPC